MEKEIIFFESGDKSVSLKVPLQDEKVWLNQAQMIQLFGRDQSVISRHVKNVFDEQEVDVESNMQILHIRGSDKPVAFYSLDVIISVGYRVKSKRGVEFRKWANSVLKQYIMNGYAENTRRLEELNQTIQIIKRIEKKAINLEKSQILDVIEKYTTALELLDDYDHLCVKKPEGKDLYHSIQEKAANLLYFIVKNHSFSDGNKRIAAAVFLYFLDKNNWLFTDGEKRLNDSTLVALTIMIAESKPMEKEIMVNLVMNFLV